VLLVYSGRAAPSATPQGGGPRPAHPNIVLIVADDLGWGDVGFNGRNAWETPNLDRLAAQGTIFRRWYAPGVVCAPSRAAFLTGRYGIHNGVPGNGDDLPADEVTIAEALKQHDYVTGLFGKWHHGGPRSGRTTYVHPMDQGFDEFFGFTNARAAWQHFPAHLWVGRDERPVQGYADTLFTDRAIEFVSRHKEHPFFLYLAFTAPHRVVEAPAEELAKHKGKFTEADAGNPAYAAYAAMVTQQDEEVGRLMKALDQHALADETVVIFTSDHGATFETDRISASAYHDSNRPFRGQKRNLWEGGIRVPGVVRWPGKVPAGRVSSEVTSMIDLMPTLLAAAGAQPDSARKLDGANLLEVWLGKAKAPERTLFWEWRTEGYQQIAAMRGDLKLVITGGNPPELFNVECDPAERISLAAEDRELVTALRAALQAWLATESQASKEAMAARAKTLRYD
jgi:arylsulfatase A-like enzyme